MKALLLLFFLAFYFVPEAHSQSLPEPRQSPLGLTRAMIDDTYIKVIYGRPSVRDREIFGTLVPFGEVWRTGANEATEITFTGNLIINGEEIPAGTYSIFTIPNVNEWTIILNSGLGQWGNYSYDRSLDILRFTVESLPTTEHIEMFTIGLEQSSDNHVTLQMMWDNVMLGFDLEKLN